MIIMDELALGGIMLGGIIIVGMVIVILIGIAFGRYMVNSYEPDYDVCRRRLGMPEED